jgi:membrane protein YdbS with pleckstrin-like domain
METNNTLFENGQLDISSLPQAELMEMIPLEPAYKKVRYIGASIFSILLILVVAVILLFNSDWGLFGFLGAGVIAFLAIWNIIYQGLSFTYMGYALREKDVSFKSGWLWKSITTVPFNRVQHCDFKQGLLDRQYGLAKLTIYTAGGQNTDLEIPGLLLDTAERMKSYILQATEHSIENE